MPKQNPTRLFHAVIVVGSALTLPAIVIDLGVAVAAIGAPGCGGGGRYGNIGVDLSGGYNNLGVDLSGTYVDIGVPPDIARPVDEGGHD
jgi:hypothetical protein